MAALILAILKAFPIVDKWASLFLAIYLQHRYQGMKQENIDALHTLMTKGDQREVETLLGYSRAGKPSGIPGAQYTDSLPGVPPA